MIVELTPKVIYRSAAVCIRDIACRAHRPDRGAEEWATTTDLVFPRGGVFVKHVAGQRVVADANSVLFFNRHETYSVSHPVGCGDDCTALTFPIETLRDAVAVHDPVAADVGGEVFRVTHAPTDRASVLGLHRIRRALRHPDADALAYDEAALGLLASVVEHARRRERRRRSVVRPTTQRAHEETVHATRLFLADRFHEPLTLDEISRQVYCSPFHLVRLFRSIVGRPIHRHLTELRLRAALERLADGAGNLTALALDLGFSSHSHFTTVFRRGFGCAPSDYRRGVGAHPRRKQART